MTSRSAIRDGGERLRRDLCHRHCAKRGAERAVLMYAARLRSYQEYEQYLLVAVRFAVQQYLLVAVRFAVPSLSSRNLKLATQ